MKAVDAIILILQQLDKFYSLKHGGVFCMKCGHMIEGVREETKDMVERAKKELNLNEEHLKKLNGLMEKAGTTLADFVETRLPNVIGEQDIKLRVCKECVSVKKFEMMETDWIIPEVKIMEEFIEELKLGNFENELGKRPPEFQDFVYKKFKYVAMMMSSIGVVFTSLGFITKDDFLKLDEEEQTDLTNEIINLFAFQK